MSADGELIEVRSELEGALLGYLPAPPIIPHGRVLRYRVRWPGAGDSVELHRRFGRRLWRSADYEIALQVGRWTDAAGERWCIVCTVEEWMRLQLAPGFELAQLMEES